MKLDLLDWTYLGLTALLLALAVWSVAVGMPGWLLLLLGVSLGALGLITMVVVMSGKAARDKG